jgi:HD superfamily phosphohydrolase YqeK
MIVAMHPLVRRAADGCLPDWSRAGPARREHMARVAELLGAWARAQGLGEEDRLRWTAAGWLHDALRDAPPEELRPRVGPGDRALPGPVLHGPAAAEALRAEGVEDRPLLRAVAWHTLGDPDFDALGRATYAADFLDPGRDLRNAWRAGLRARMPGELDTVVREIVAARIAHQVGRGGLLQPRTVAFWNLLASGS